MPADEINVALPAERSTETPVWVVAAAWCWAFAIAVASVACAVRVGNDAQMRWRELQYTLKGVDPIDVATEVVKSHREIGALSKLAGYPPWSYVFAGVFFTPLPWSVAYGWFLTLHVVALAGIGWIGYHAGAVLAPGDHRMRWITAAAALGTCNIAVCMYYGNYGILVTALLIGAFAAVRGGNSSAAGILWGLAMVKPQVGLLYGICLVVQRAWGAVIVGGILIAAAWAAASALIGKPPVTLLTEMLEQSARHVGGPTGGFQGAQEALLMLGVPKGAMLALGLATGAAVIYGLMSRAGKNSFLSALVIPSAVIPVFMHHRTHDLVIQAPLVALVALKFVDSARRRAFAGAALDAILIAFLVVPIPYRFTLTVPMLHVPWRLMAFVALWRIWPLLRASAIESETPPAENPV